MKPNLVIIMEGGLISHFVADSEMEIIVIDYDTEGLSEDEITEVFGNKAYVYTHNLPVEDVSPKLVNEIKEQIVKEAENERT